MASVSKKPAASVSSCKRPATSDGSTLPLSGESGAKRAKSDSNLTEANLALVPADPNNALQFKLAKLRESEEVVDSSKAEVFLNSLNTKERMSLWKAFEKERHGQGTDARAVEDAFSACKGPGSNLQKQNMLKAWVKGGLKEAAVFCKVEFDHEDRDLEEEEWIPFRQAKQWYGEAELKARLEAGALVLQYHVFGFPRLDRKPSAHCSGTLVYRRNPKDKRFVEIKKEKQSKQKINKAKTSFGAKGSGKLDLKDFKLLQDQSASDGEAQDSEPEEIKKLFGKGKGSKPKPENPDANPAADAFETASCSLGAEADSKAFGKLTKALALAKGKEAKLEKLLQFSGLEKQKQGEAKKFLASLKELAKVLDDVKKNLASKGAKKKAQDFCKKMISVLRDVDTFLKDQA